PDANLEKSVEAIMSSAFGAAGERCLAGSVLVAVGAVAEPLLDLLLQKTREMRVGDGSKPETDMGPLVTAEHRNRVVGYIEKGIVGVNVGVAAPMAFFPFSGWKDSFFGDLHAHGRDAISFYTEQKVIMTRWI